MVAADLVATYQVLEEDVKFYLYTREVSGLQLTKDNICEVNPANDVKILTHGRGPYSNSSTYWVGELTNIYLSLDDYNIIHVDWTKLAAELNPIPIDHATNVGECHLVWKLQEMRKSNSSQISLRIPRRFMPESYTNNEGILAKILYKRVLTRWCKIFYVIVLFLPFVIFLQRFLETPSRISRETL